MSARISLRLEGFSLKIPRRALVTIVEPCFFAPRIILETRHQLGVRAGDTVGRFEQAFAVGLFTDGQKDLAHRLLNPREIDLRVLQVGSVGCIGWLGHAADYRQSGLAGVKSQG